MAVAVAVSDDRDRRGWGKAQEEIHQAIWERVAHGYPVPSASWVSDTTGVEGSHVRREFGRLVEVGVLEKLDRGSYRLLEDPEGQPVPVLVRGRTGWVVADVPGAPPEEPSARDLLIRALKVLPEEQGDG